MNRFEGYDREEELMKNGLKLMAENKLWAALVFTNTGGPNSTEIPKFIRYKIRMDAQKVDSTKRIEDRQVSLGRVYSVVHGSRHPHQRSALQPRSASRHFPKTSPVNLHDNA